jgi:protease IV
MNVRFWPVMVLAVVVLAGCSLPKFSLFPEAGPLKEVTLEGTADEKILVLSIDGTISDKPKEKLMGSRPSMVQQLVSQLKRAEKDDKIKAVLLKVNSPGGTVTASDIIYHEISAYKERTGVKMVVSMVNVAASGGYYVSLPADWIMAHPTTVTGSIGVIFARPGVSGFMEKLGLSMYVQKSGARKDMGSPFRPPTEADNVIFQKLIDDMAGRFLGLVAKHRNIKPEYQAQVASAQIFSAAEAQQVGLVDQIGYLNDAIAKAKSLAGLSSDAKVVTYRHYQSEDDNIYNPSMRAQGGDIGVNGSALSLLTAAQEAGFYYLWAASLGQ